MTFRTELQLPPVAPDFAFTYSDKILCIGSCFAENMAARLQHLQLSALVNPFGILFNPVSMAQSLDLLVQQYKFTENDLVAQNDLYHSWRHHGRFSDTTVEKTLQNIQQATDNAVNFLPPTTRLVLTFGTAHVFRERTSGRIVANCHKRPAADFDRELLSVNEIVDIWSHTLKVLFAQNPTLRVVLTVSPVRYLREGLIANQRSKATLTLAAAALEAQFRDKIAYFPAYELLHDDLRDYRFYAPDLTHPNQMAIDYIFEVFQRTFFTPDTLATSTAVEKVLKRLAHRPLHEQTAAFRLHQTQTLAELIHLEQQFPYLDFSSEKQLLLAATKG